LISVSSVGHALPVYTVESCPRQCEYRFCREARWLSVTPNG
jgi:hypothetical protein